MKRCTTWWAWRVLPVALLLIGAGGAGECAGTPVVIKLKTIGKGTVMAADPAASAGTCVAMSVGDETGMGPTNVWTLRDPKLVAGLYHVSLRLRWHGPHDFNRSRLGVTFRLLDSTAPALDMVVQSAHLDDTPGAYTDIQGDVLLMAPGNLKLEGIWSIAAPPPGQKNVRARRLKDPSLAERELPGAKGAGSRDLDALEELVSSDEARPLKELLDPVILLDKLTLVPVSTSLVVEKVWPEYVHVYPGQTNPVTVTVRNVGAVPAQAVLRLDMLTGLDEAGPPQQVDLTIPARSAVSHRFQWVAGTREFGHEAKASLLVAGETVHRASEYFSVSAPIWKTAIQGSGFVSWTGRENKLAPHVDENRRAYVNVEEAFSWQPSSWNDLNPTNDEWSAGQNNFHNSLAGLKEWIGCSHSNGIKMITYSWPTVSGKSGFDWGRRNPDLLTRQTGGSGLAAQVDLEDLRLYDITHERPEFRYYQSGIWANIGINLGYLRSMHLHAEEVIKSARRFGWDGLRFDYPPRWSPMDTSCVHWEFGLLGVTNVMRELMPEYINTTNKVWSEAAITARNVRYARYIFKKELGPNFALSYNDGSIKPLTKENLADFREFCGDGGQVMNEAIRGVGSMEHYLNVVLAHTEATRAVGGYGNVFQAEKCQVPLASVYSGIITFAAGSHPYLDYGWRSMPGKYTQLMTRYGEYFWDLALAPVEAGAAGVVVDEGSKPLLWKPFIRQRQAGAAMQTVIQLINPPEWDPVKAASQFAVPWRRPVVVRKRGEVPPTVWLLTAEPLLAATQLTARREGDGFAVTVPEIRYWSTLVWSEAK